MSDARDKGTTREDGSVMGLIERDAPPRLAVEVAADGALEQFIALWHDADKAKEGEVEYVRADLHRGAVEEAEKWKRIAQDRCTCVRTCGDTAEESGGVCKELPRGGQ